MLLNSFQFLLFFGVFFIFYSILFNGRTKIQNWLILLASYYFYGVVDWRMDILLLGITFFFYSIGITIEKYHKKWVLTIGILFAVGILFYFKYLNFFISQIVKVTNTMNFHLDDITLKIILPIGISFYLFKLMCYIIEVYRGNIPACRDFVAFASYVSFFPTVMSGPIDRPNKFLPQFHQKRLFNAKNVVEGLCQIMWGLFLKMCVADRINLYVNAVYGNLSNHNGTTVFIAILLYSIQIYADFAGYSDMAIGVGRVMGFDVMKNFDHPYFARNVSEFWRKWHISLTSWLTEYIYIPLGGNRKGKLRTILNTLVVFSLCGLWHGAGWNYILWGGVNGMLFIPSLLSSKPKKYKGVPLTFDYITIVKISVTFLVISFTWLIFHESSIENVFLIFQRLFSPWGMPYANSWHIFIVVLLALFIHEVHHATGCFVILEKIPVEIKTSLYVLLCLMFGVYNSNSFIYFQF